MENTSGQGKAAILPPELKGWNWGAFLLNIIWGIGNDTYIALLMLVPLVGFVMPFVLGAKGNEWAWRNRRWDSVEHFKRVQRNWAKWGSIIAIGYLTFFAIFILGFYFLFKNSEAYLLSVARIQNNADAIGILGEPISAGFPLGNISVNGSTGKATLNFSAEGPKSKASVYVEATKLNGVWKLDLIELQPANGGRRVRLN